MMRLGLGLGIVRRAEGSAVNPSLPPELTSVTFAQATGAVGTLNITFDESAGLDVEVRGYITPADADPPSLTDIVNGTGAYATFAVEMETGDTDVAVDIVGAIEGDFDVYVTARFTSPLTGWQDAVVDEDVAIDTVIPVVLTRSPADDGTDVGIAANLVIVFSKSMTTNTGTVTLKLDGGATVETFDLSTDGSWSTTTLTDDTLTLNPASDLTHEEGYAVLNADLLSSTGMELADVADDTTWNFTTAELPPPVITATSFVDEGDSVGTLNVTFDAGETTGTPVTIAGYIIAANGTPPADGEAVAAGVDALGTFLVEAEVDDTDIPVVILGSFDATCDVYVTTRYATSDWGNVVVDEDVAIDCEPPSIVSYSPADNATEVGLTANLVIVFSETMTTTAGTVTLKAVDGADIEVFDLSSDGSWSTTTATDDTLTLNPAVNFGPGVAMAVKYTGLVDANDNPLSDVDNDTTWNFTATASPPEFTMNVSGEDIVIETEETGDLTVTIADGDYAGTYTITTAEQTAMESAPHNEAVPTITDDGTPAPGETLALDLHGLWFWMTADSPMVLSYQWDADGTPISGETGEDYVIDAGDAGAEITLVETATNDAGSAEAESDGVFVGEPWDPELHMATDMGVLFDFSKTSSVTTSGGRATAVANLGAQGSACNLSVSVGLTNGPSTTTLNGVPALDFGADNAMAFSNINATPDHYMAGNVWTTFIVFGAASSGRVLFNHGSNTSIYFRVEDSGSNTLRIRLFRNVNSDLTYPGSAGDPDVDSPGILVLRKAANASDPTGIALRWNGEAISSDIFPGSTGSQEAGGSLTYLGRRMFGTSGDFGGVICAYGFSIFAVPEDEVEAIEGYFAHLYGITLDSGHPWASSPPTYPLP